MVEVALEEGVDLVDQEVEEDEVLQEAVVVLELTRGEAEVRMVAVWEFEEGSSRRK